MKNRMRAAVMLLGLAGLLSAAGCPSMQLAAHPPTRGPLKGKVEFNEDGSTKSVDLDSAGGSASDIYYEKNIEYENGKPKSNHVVLTSDVSTVVRTQGDVVLRQSQQDLSAAISVIKETASTIKDLAATAVSLKTQLDAAKPPPSTQPCCRPPPPARHRCGASAASRPRRDCACSIPRMPRWPWRCSPSTTSPDARTGIIAP